MFPSILPVYARADLSFVRGEGSWLFDDKNNAYLDMAAGVGVTLLGHSHPVLIEALKTQADKLWHTSNLYHIPNQQTLADILVKHTFAAPVEVAPDATLTPIIFPTTGEDVTSCAGVALANTYADPTAAPLELTVDMVSDNGKMTCQITGTAPADGSMGVYGVQGTNSGGTSTATVTISVTE